MVSISVVRARAVQELYSGQHEPGVGALAQVKKKSGPWLTRQLTTSKLPSRVASSEIHRI